MYRIRWKTRSVNHAEMGDSAHTKRAEEIADLTISLMGNKVIDVAGSSQDSSEAIVYSMLINRVLSGQASSQDLERVSGIQKALTRILSSTNVPSTVTSMSDNHQGTLNHNETQSTNPLSLGFMLKIYIKLERLLYQHRQTAAAKCKPLYTIHSLLTRFRSKLILLHLSTLLQFLLNYRGKISERICRLSKQLARCSRYYHQWW